MKKRFYLGLLAVIISYNGYAENITVVVNSWPPYVDKTLPGKGLAMQIVTAAMQRKGYQTKVAIETWDRALEGLNVGVYDVIGAIWKIPQREQTMLFSEPYLVNQIKFFKKKSTPVSFQSLDDLSGYLIGTVRNYAYDDAFVQSEKLLKIPANHIIQNLLKLREGQIDLAVGDERAISYELNQYMHGQAQDYDFLPKQLAEQGLHIAASKQNPAAKKIIAAFNQAIHEMQADGSLQKILDNYSSGR